MNEQIDEFMSRLKPLGNVWTHFVVSCAAVQYKEKWVALSTLIELRAEDSRPEPFVLDGIPGLLVTTSWHEPEAFAEYASDVTGQRTLVVSTGEDIELAVPSPHGTNERISYSGPYICKPDFRLPGSASFSVELNTCPIGGYVVGLGDQVQDISSAVRSKSKYSGLPQLFKELGLDPGSLTGHCTRLIVRAVIPILISQESDDRLEVAAPPRVMARSRVKIFLAEEVHEIKPDAGGEGCLEGTITLNWPQKASAGEVHLFFENYELASTQVKRWSGTSNWRVAVDRYFGEGPQALDLILAERKVAEWFESGVARLFGLLGIPAVWYGGKNFQDRPDIAATFELRGEWIVVLGECTMHKPTDKFAMLLTRTKQLEAALGRQALVIPVVFTNTEVSSADKNHAQRDGISLVGREELLTLQSMIAKCAPASDVVSYLES